MFRWPWTASKRESGQTAETSSTPEAASKLESIKAQVSAWVANVFAVAEPFKLPMPLRSHFLGFCWVIGHELEAH